jgi:hypothetical protein
MIRVADLTINVWREREMASKDKGAKTPKKPAKKNLKEKRQAKKMKKAK